MKLTSSDAQSLINFRKWVAKQGEHDAEYLGKLKHRENQLSSTARQAWRSWPSERLVSELAKWLPAYRLQYTRQGFRAHRYNKARRGYNVRAERGGMNECEAADYTHLVRL